MSVRGAGPELRLGRRRHCRFQPSVRGDTKGLAVGRSSGVVVFRCRPAAVEARPARRIDSLRPSRRGCSRRPRSGARPARHIDSLRPSRRGCSLRPRSGACPARRLRTRPASAPPLHRFEPARCHGACARRATGVSPRPSAARNTSGGREPLLDRTPSRARLLPSVSRASCRARALPSPARAPSRARTAALLAGAPSRAQTARALAGTWCRPRAPRALAGTSCRPRAPRALAGTSCGQRAPPE